MNNHEWIDVSPKLANLVKTKNEDSNKNEDSSTNDDCTIL